MTSLLDLPRDVIFFLLLGQHHLSLEDILCCSWVCRRLYRIVHDDATIARDISDAKTAPLYRCRRLNEIAERAVVADNVRLIDWLVAHRGDVAEVVLFQRACFRNRIRWVERFRESADRVIHGDGLWFHLRSGIYYAAKGGHDALCHTLSKSSTSGCWNLEEGAIRGGHVNLFSRHVPFKSIPWGRFTGRAAQVGDMAWLRWMEEKGVDLPRELGGNAIFWAARGGRKEVISWMIQKLGDQNTDEGLRGAARGGHLHLMAWFAMQGATDWQDAQREAMRGGHMISLVYAISQRRGPVLKRLWIEAIQKGHTTMASLFLDHHHPPPFGPGQSIDEVISDWFPLVDRPHVKRWWIEYHRTRAE